MKKNLLLICIAVLGVMARPSSAAVIAIIDSGTDLSHPDLVNKQWNNPLDPDDAIDNDGNSLVDDTHGWNFADNNNHLYDKKLLGTFPQDDYTFFDVQLRQLLGTATDTDKQWIKSHKDDQQFLLQLETFANWLHGTHVAGIAARDAAQAQIMVFKIIPTQARAILKTGLDKAWRENASPSTTPSWRDKLIRMGLNYLAKAQSVLLGEVAQYMHDHGAQVANCSFGTSTATIKELFKQLLPPFLGHTPSDEELTDYAKYFVDRVTETMEQSFVGLAPHTLFVIAAGNDGQNNDELPTAPANLRLENTITVAATVGYERLASFSNYGAEMVDVAAPGVGIKSSIPGKAYLTVSGTSQATPFITNIAGRVLDANPKLSLSEVKLIIMETVDKKDYLKGKVKSEGIANPLRSVTAAKLSVTEPVENAIIDARHEVPDVISVGPHVEDDRAGVVKLPSMF